MNVTFPYTIPSISTESPLFATKRELNKIKAEEFFRRIYNSIQPHLFDIIAPLNLDNEGVLYFDRKRWEVEEFSQENWITLELTLNIATECRKRIALIFKFINPKNEEKTNLITEELEAPVKNVLRQFLDEFTENMQQKCDSGFKDLFDHTKFLKSQQKQLNTIFLPIEKLVGRRNQQDTFLLISEFWAEFIQSLNFWLFHSEISKWKEELFDGFVSLLCKYLSEIIFGAKESSRKIDFIEQIWAEDEFTQDKIAFSIYCIQFMPKNVIDELPGFDEIFYENYKNAKEQKRIKFTINFLTKLVNASLRRFLKQLCGYILSQIKQNGSLPTHLKQIKDFYSLKMNSLRYWLPDFTSNFDQSSVEKSHNDVSMRNQIEKSDSILKDEEKGKKNQFYRIQHWSVCILLNSRLFNLLDNIFGRLYKFIYIKNCIINAWKNGEENGLGKLDIWNIKTRIRTNLFNQLAQMFQSISQILLSQFSFTNSFYSTKLLSNLEGPEGCVKLAISTVEEWCQIHKLFNEIISNTLTDPIEELESIALELIEIPMRINPKENMVGEEDIDVLKYAKLLNRLRRVRLFIRNIEMNGDESESVIIDSTTFQPMSILKMLIPE